MDRGVATIRAHGGTMEVHGGLSPGGAGVSMAAADDPAFRCRAAPRFIGLQQRWSELFREWDMMLCPPMPPRCGPIDVGVCRGQRPHSEHVACENCGKAGWTASGRPGRGLLTELWRE